MATDRASLSKVVSEKIRGQILAGRLKPGERLIADRLSAELGVSRVPVREALRGLSMEGLVRLEPNRGASVTEVTPQLLAELVALYRTGLHRPLHFYPRSSWKYASSSKASMRPVHGGQCTAKANPHGRWAR